jgi:hypothetical protein
MNRDEQPKVDTAQPETSDNRSYDPQEVEPSTSMDAPLSQPSEVPEPLQPLPPQPISPVVETPPAGLPMAPQQKLRPKWLLPVIIAAVLVVLGGSSALAYKFWYQNPQKVIGDGLMHAIEAKSMTYKAMVQHKGTSGTVNVVVTGVSKDGANSANTSVGMVVDGKTYTLKGSVVVNKNSDIYLKVANVDTLLADFEAQLPVSARQVVTDFVKKINDQWIVISNEKIKTFSDAYAKMQKCTQSVVEKIQSDKSYSSEIVDLYKAHPFLKITKELGSKDGSLGYEVSDNQKEDKAFSEGVKNTKAYKMLHECDSSLTIDTQETSGTTSTTTVQIWVSRWSHEITKITANDKDDDGTTAISFEPVFNTGSEVKAPAKAKSVDELMNDIQQLESALLEASMEAQSAQTGSLFS